MDPEKEMKQGKLPIKITCPFCNKTLDGYTALDGGGGPSEGDFTLCVFCLTPLRYGSGLRLRLIQEEELDELEPAQRERFVKAIEFFRGSTLFGGGKGVH